MMRIIILSVLLAAGRITAAETNQAVKLDEKTTIESYSQGKLTIGGKLIRSDIIILPDGTVKEEWQTKKRHILTTEDIPDLIKTDMDVLVVGTGNTGMMKPEPSFKKAMKDQGRNVLYLKTDAAIKKIKTLRSDGKKVGACLHIGC